MWAGHRIRSSPVKPPVVVLPPVAIELASTSERETGDTGDAIGLEGDRLLGLSESVSLGDVGDMGDTAHGLEGERLLGLVESISTGAKDRTDKGEDEVELRRLVRCRSLPAPARFPLPITPISATKGIGLEGRVDILPLRIDSSYEPTRDPNSSEDGCAVAGGVRRVPERALAGAGGGSIGLKK